MLYNQQLDFMTRQPQLFVIEGPDCTGKTSLARFIANKLNACYMHSTWTPALNGQAQSDYLRSTLNNANVCLSVSGLDVVLDRHWPSEVCYHKTFRPEQPVVMIQEFFASLTKATYVFCGGINRSIAIERQLAKADNRWTKEQLIKLHAEYIRCFSNLCATEEKIHNYSIEEHGDKLDGFLEMILK